MAEQAPIQKNILVGAQPPVSKVGRGHRGFLSVAEGMGFLPRTLKCLKIGSIETQFPTSKEMVDEAWANNIYIILLLQVTADHRRLKNDIRITSF